jgi:O-antigen ligase/Flp pilus assembly protein TadD
MTDRFTKITMGLLLIWVPLAYYYRAADGFTLPKEFVGLLALGFLAGLILFSGATGLWRLSLLLTSGLFLAWMMGDSLAVSLVKLEAVKGFIHLALMVGTLWATVFLCARGLSYERLLHYALGAGVFMALYGIIQTLGGDPTQWTTRFSSRAFSTLGNPDYLGGHLAALIPLAAVLTLRSENRQAWLAYRLIAMVFLICLLMTRVRGAEIAVVAAFLFIAFFFFRPWGRGLFDRNRKFVLAFLGIVVIVGCIWTVWKGNLSSLNESRVSIEQRTAIYKTAWEMIKENPWFGIGAGQVGMVYPAYQFKPYIPSDYPNHPYVYTEHIHNEFLQFWVEGGVIGILLFLGILVAYGLALRKTLAMPQVSPKDRELLLGVSAALVALLVQAMSNFPFQVAPTTVLFGLFLAAPLALRPAPALPQPLKLSAAKGAVIGLVLLVVAGIGVRAVGASIAYRDTAGETALAHPEKAVYYGARLVGLSPMNPKAWNLYGQALEDGGQNEEALKAFQKSLDLNPDYVENLMAMADLEAKAGQLPEALAFAQRALALTPNFLGPLWVQAYCQYQLKQYGPAAESFEQFLTYVPNSPDAWMGLGVCDIHLGKKAEAIQAWQKTHQLAPDNIQVLQFLKGAGAKVENPS